jgi:hypothetical protein
LAITIYGRHYTVSQVITNPGAVTNLVLHAAATKPFVVIHCTIEPAQSALVTEAGAVIRLTRKTAAGTYTSIAASTFLNHDPTDADAALTAGHTATAEGTDGDFVPRGWNSKQGFEWLPTPEEYIVVPAGVANGFALKSNVAPPAGAYAFTITVVELG